MESYNYFRLKRYVIYMVYEATTSKEVFGQTWKKPTNWVSTVSITVQRTVLKPITVMEQPQRIEMPKEKLAQLLSAWTLSSASSSVYKLHKTISSAYWSSQALRGFYTCFDLNRRMNGWFILFRSMSIHKLGHSVPGSLRQPSSSHFLLMITKWQLLSPERKTIWLVPGRRWQISTG